MNYLWPFLIIGLFVWWLRRPRHHWVATHQSGFDRECTECGERQSKYMLWMEGDTPEWWETTKDGDGRCGVPPLPMRWEFH